METVLLLGHCISSSSLITWLSAVLGQVMAFFITHLSLFGCRCIIFLRGDHWHQYNILTDLVPLYTQTEKKEDMLSRGCVNNSVNMFAMCSNRKHCIVVKWRSHISLALLSVIRGVQVTDLDQSSAGEISHILSLLSRTSFSHCILWRHDRRSNTAHKGHFLEEWRSSLQFPQNVCLL